MGDSAPEWFRPFYGEWYEASVRPALTPQRSADEVDFLLSATGVRPPGHVADVPCGSGRHVAALARRGLAVTGVDLNPDFVSQARERTAGMADVRLVEDDMREAVPGPYDLVVCLFNSFGFFGDEGDAAFVSTWTRELRTGGHLVMDIWNRARIEAQFHPEQVWETAEKLRVHEVRRLDRDAGRLDVDYAYREPGGPQDVRRHASFRLYTRAELEAIFGAAGLEPVAAYGSLRGEPFDPDESPNLVLVGRRA